MRGIKTFEDWEERENRWRDDLRVSAERSVKVSGWKVKRGEFRGDNKRKTSKEEKHSDNEVTGFPRFLLHVFLLAGLWRQVDRFVQQQQPETLSQILRSRRKRSDESFCADGFILSPSPSHLKHKRNGVRPFSTCTSVLSKFHQLINCSEASLRGG